MKKLLRVLGVTVMSVVVLYYVGVNALLASPLGVRLFNSKPELVQIHYDRAWTLVPLRVDVEGFQLSMQDRLVQISIAADRVHGNLHPWTLMDGKFIATQVTASGVAMRVRPRLTKGDPLEAHLDELPPIPGYETAVRDVSSNEVQAEDIRFLSLEFKDLTVHHLRELWIDRIRYTGDAEVTGGLLYEPFRKLRIDDGHFTDANSRLVAVQPNEVAIKQVDLRVTLPQVNLGSMDFAWLRGLVADVKLSAEADPRFLNSYLTNVAGLSTLGASGAVGPLEVDVQIDQGVVADGAVLTYRTPKVAVRLPLVEVSGAAAVKGKAGKGRLALDVEVSRASLRQRDGAQLAMADRFALLASSSADLVLLPDVDAELLLRGGFVKTLASLNQFIPTGAGVRLAEGSGMLEGNLSLDAVPARARGRLDLVANDVVVKNRAATVAGRLLAHAEIRSFNLDTGAIDLSGSTIAIENATLQAGGRRWPKLWLRAVADPCLLTPKSKVLWSANVAVGSSNLQPLLAIVSANVPLPKALGMFTDSPNVKAEVTLMVREDSVELPRFTLASQNLRAEGALTLREVGDDDKRLEPWGGVLAHAGVFSAGVQLEGPKVSLVLGDLERWAASKQITPTAAAR